MLPNRSNHIRLLTVALIMLCAGCVKPFISPPSKQTLNFLVVDGAISVGSTCKIKLSRTKNLIDTVETIPETGAQMQVESESGTVYPFTGSPTGEYTASGINGQQKYRLRIRTANGKEYVSDFVETKVSPPIDSVQWVEDDDIFIYVNTHDPSGASRYYRWEFEETSEYHSVYDSNLDFRNGEIVFITPEEMRFVCFKDFPSNGILVSTSGALGDDVISKFLLNRIPNDNSKISYRYSILVRQYVLTTDAYQYWQIVKQNSEQTGNIFDPQPSQLYGNIRCVDDPNEPVIGYVSASTVSEKRIFIRQSQLKTIVHPNLEFCKETFIDPADAAEYLTGGRLMPAYFQQGALALAPPECVDCRLAGGTTAKPSYW